MAKKKAKKSEPKRKFYLGGSACGDVSQLEYYDMGPYSSVEAAKTQIEKDIKDGEFDSAYTYFVFEIVATGRPSGSLNWA